MAKEIVLIGRANVGKSTLFKELTGKKVRVGKRPGITREAIKVKVGGVFYVDMPGFGYMKNYPKGKQEKTKRFIIDYFEQNRDEILLTIQVIDASSFLDIVGRWEDRGEVPIEIGLYDFLNDLGLDVILAANKMDRIANPDDALDMIVEKFGMLPPWRQWLDHVAPISAKKSEIESLKKIIGKKIAVNPR
ncbi:MAG: GTP-binding protein EngB [Methanotrichaceae archaeon]|nr:GTP-binding protein EngB [Methanotrichaceae archaeon]